MHEQTSGVAPAVHVTFAWPSQELPRFVEPPGQATPWVDVFQESPAPEPTTPSTHEARARARMIVIGGGGHLGRNKIQPALSEMTPGIADCLERTSIRI